MNSGQSLPHRPKTAKGCLRSSAQVLNKSRGLFQTKWVLAPSLFQICIPRHVPLGTLTRRTEESTCTFWRIFFSDGKPGWQIKSLCPEALDLKPGKWPNTSLFGVRKGGMVFLRAVVKVVFVQSTWSSQPTLGNWIRPGPLENLVAKNACLAPQEFLWIFALLALPNLPSSAAKRNCPCPTIQFLIARPAICIWPSLGKQCPFLEELPYVGGESGAPSWLFK